MLTFGTGELRYALRQLDQSLSQSSPDGNKTLEKLRADPATILSMAGMKGDSWQNQVLRNRSRSSRTLLLCSRQSGKSTVAAMLALLTAMLIPGSLVLLVARAQRQSHELMLKVKELFNALGRPVPALAETVLSLSLTNGSRLVALPGAESTIRCFSGAGLIVIDEAARVPDEVYKSLRPMLAVSGGSLIALSTAWARQGWFHSAWTGGEDWNRVKVPASMCPRIGKRFLEEEKVALGQRWWRMEYNCEFGEAVDSVFRPEDIEAAFSGASVKPLFA